MYKVTTDAIAISGEDCTSVFPDTACTVTCVMCLPVCMAALGCMISGLLEAAGSSSPPPP